jgi:NAD-specific glutamate dehydrogenase
MMSPKHYKQQIISKKKNIYKVSKGLLGYLKEHDREIKLPVNYADLKNFKGSFAILDKKGNDTLWEAALYEPGEKQYLHDGLKQIYSILKTGGDTSVHEHLHVERVDYCTFGNSNPFRIKIVNNFNDNYDYFYIKQADASRIYGLELEHILSPSRINFFVDNETLVEEHIAGVPGDMFIQFYLENREVNKVRIAKEFVKFNERCFVQLLGDMRSYNYVFDITPDFEEVQFRIRAIDFDQQSYEGKRTLYLPQFFKENNALVALTLKLLSEDNIRQYQKEERTLIARRSISAQHRLNHLLTAMGKDEIAPKEKVEQLKKELGEHYKTDAFNNCKSMGEIVRASIQQLSKSPGK